MKIYHEEYGYGYIIERIEWMGIAKVEFSDSVRMLPLEELEVVE